MNIKRTAFLVLAMAMLVATGCKDNSEVVCEGGKCYIKGGKKQVVEVEGAAMKSMPQLAQMDEPANQGFSPIQEALIEEKGLMAMAGEDGHYNSVMLDDVEIPGVGHAEAAIYGEEYIEREYRDNLWPGGVEQGADIEFDEF